MESETFFGEYSWIWDNSVIVHCASSMINWIGGNLREMGWLNWEKAGIIALSANFTR